MSQIETIDKSLTRNSDTPAHGISFSEAVRVATLSFGRRLSGIVDRRFISFERGSIATTPE